MEVFRPSYREIDDKQSKIQNRNSKFSKENSNKESVGTGIKGKSIFSKSSSSKTIAPSTLKDDDIIHDADTGSGFGANVQTFKRDIVHLKKLFPRKYMITCINSCGHPPRNCSRKRNQEKRGTYVQRTFSSPSHSLFFLSFVFFIYPTDEHRSSLKEMLKDGIPPESWLPSYPDLYTIEEQLAERFITKVARRQRRLRQQPLSTAESFRAVDALVYPDIVTASSGTSSHKSYTSKHNNPSLVQRTHSSYTSGSTSSSSFSGHRQRNHPFVSSSEDEDYIDTEATSIPEDSDIEDDTDLHETEDIYSLPNNFSNLDIDENNYPFRQQRNLHCHHNHIPLIPRPIGYTSDDDEESLPEINEDLPIFITPSNKANEWQSLASKAIAAVVKQRKSTTDDSTTESSVSSRSSSGSSTWEASDDDEDDMDDSYESESFPFLFENQTETDHNSSVSHKNLPVKRGKSSKQLTTKGNRLSTSPTKGDTKKKEYRNNNGHSTEASLTTLPRGRKVAVATLIHDSTATNGSNSLYTKSSKGMKPSTVNISKPSLSGTKRQRGHLRIIGSGVASDEDDNNDEMDDDEEEDDEEEYTDDSVSSYSDGSNGSFETETESNEEEESYTDKRTKAISSTKLSRSVPKKVDNYVTKRTLSASRLRGTLPHNDDENIVSDEELANALNNRSQRRPSLRRSSSSSHKDNNDEHTMLRSGSSRLQQSSCASTLRSGSTVSLSKSYRQSNSTPASRTTSRTSSALSMYNTSANSKKSFQNKKSKNKKKNNNNNSPPSSRLKLSKRLRLDNVLTDTEQQYPSPKEPRNKNHGKFLSSGSAKTTLVSSPQSNTDNNSRRKSSRLHPENTQSLSNNNHSNGALSSKRSSSRINGSNYELFALWG